MPQYLNLETRERKALAFRLLSERLVLELRLSVFA